MSQPEPSEQVLLQRIRNRIIEELEMLASFEEQRAYEARVPIVYVPHELICSWEDYVPNARPAHFVAPVFSEAECTAVERVHAAWAHAADALPDNYPPLEQVLNEPYWACLRDAACEALVVFRVRGKLSEDTEVP